MSESRLDKADRFRELHHQTKILVLPNAWDVASACLVAEAGFAAVATTSAGMAALYGHPDGEGMTSGEVVAMVERIVRAVPLPVSVDIETGYRDVSETVRGVWAAGAVGINLEDGELELGKALDAIATARRVAPHIVINARTDVFWRGTGDYDEAVRRGNLFLEAGADCVFVPALADAATIGRLVQDIDGPVNLLAGPGVPSVKELEALGVSRVSVGSGIARACLAAVRDALAELQTDGSYGFSERAIPYGEVNELMRRARPLREDDA